MYPRSRCQPSQSMPEREIEIERFGNLKLRVGGKNGYVGVRGGVGPGRKQFQGYTVGKKHTTAYFPTAHGAAVALAQLKINVEAGMAPEPRKRPRKARDSGCCQFSQYTPIARYYVLSSADLRAWCVCVLADDLPVSTSTPRPLLQLSRATLGPMNVNIPIGVASNDEPKTSALAVGCQAGVRCQQQHVSPQPLTTAQAALLYAMGMVQTRGTVA